jgi:hypothetical protein
MTEREIGLARDQEPLRKKIRFDPIPPSSRRHQLQIIDNYEVKLSSGSTMTKIGADLMANAFNENGPEVKIADVATDRGKGLQMGFKFSLPRQSAGSVRP